MPNVGRQVLWGKSRLTELLKQIYYSASLNLTISEAIGLIVLWLIVLYDQEQGRWPLVAYSVFLILYITILRRTPGCSETIKLYLRMWPNAGIWAGNLLNLFLYVPLGWAGQYWKEESKKIVIAGFALSLFCEVTQYLTGRGWADVNDVVFNTAGTFLGSWIAQKSVQNVLK